MDKDRFIHPIAHTKEHLLGTVRAIEIESAELAEGALAEGEVTIGITENYPIDNTLPREMIELFDDIGNKATHATAINVGLRYDKANKFFMPTSAAILLNNQAVIEFSQSRRMVEMGAFYMQIVDSSGMLLVAPPPQSTFGTFSADELEIMLKSVGLELPHHEQPAEWSAIGHILGSSKRWQTVAEQSIILGPEYQVLVRDTVDGGMYDMDDNPEALLYPVEIWQRTLTIGVDSARNGRLLPSSSLQLCLTSDNPFETPRYNGISRVPVAHNNSMSEYDMPTNNLEFPELIRSELDEKRKPVKPNTKLLDSLRNAILEARISLDAASKLD